LAREPERVGDAPPPDVTTVTAVVCRIPLSGLTMFDPPVVHPLQNAANSRKW
jgi:hypothetical protein